MIGPIRRDPRRAGNIGTAARFDLSGPLDAGFNLADAGEVFVHLPAVRGSELIAEPPGILGNEIEDTLAVEGPLLRGLGIFPVPKRRSNTCLGLISLAIGVLGDFQEMFDWYAQLYPESQRPACRPASIPSSNEGSRVSRQFCPPRPGQPTCRRRYRRRRSCGAGRR